MVTEAVAELSTQTQGQGSTPPRRVVHWRYGMGFVVLLASILSLVLVGQIAGWIQDPRGAAQAGAAADDRAASLQIAVRMLPAPDADAVAEADYATAVQASDGVLLDVTYAGAVHGGGSAVGPVGFTARLSGTSTSGVLSGHHLTVVTRCYLYSWTSRPATTVHRQVACPAVGSGAGSGAEPAVRTGAGTGAGADAERIALQRLAMRLDALPPVRREVGADARGVQELLAAAGPVPDLPREAAYPLRSGTVRDMVLAIGRGGTAGCLFADLHGGALTVWSAPVLAPCTAARASQAVLAN